MTASVQGLSSRYDRGTGAKTFARFEVSEVSAP
jgi:hypothetical protein